MYEWLRTRGGYPVVDWQVFKSKVDERPDPRVLHDATHIWLDALWNVLGEHYRIETSEHFTILAGVDPSSFLLLLERARGDVLDTLPDIAVSQRMEVVLFFDTVARLHDYFAAVDEGDGEWIGEAAGYLPNVTGGVLYAPGVEERDVLHGLAHTMTMGGVAPLWVYEMLALYAVSDPAPGTRFEGNVADFLSGQSFFDEGAREGSLALAARLAEKLSVDYDAFRRFVRQAHWEDGGEAAARSVFGVRLTDVIRP